MFSSNKACATGCLIAILVPIAIIIILIGIISVASTQQRHFQKIGCYDFTIYDYSGYVIPFRYYGLSKPNIYIKASERGGVMLFVAPDSTIYVFPRLTYLKGANDMEFHLPKYKYKFFPNTEKTKDFFEDSMQYCKKQAYPSVEYFFDIWPQ